MSESGSGGTARASVVVVGVGNTLLGDDGVGYCLARAVEACGGVEGARIAAVQMINPGHVSLLEGARYAVFLDAYLSPDMPEDADIAVLELDPTRLDPLDAAMAIEGFDPHNIDPLKLMVLARATGVFEGKGYLIGIRPERIEFNSGLTPRVVSRALKALAKLEEILERLGGRLRAEPGCVERWMREKCRGPLLE